ncbi:MAG: DUF4956 domain-containing protein [Candidatus Eisenbacteria bacterium]|uniref:DUF4956 domain-containing protein n=1 Tax=Eiseniibacteriota bacterium TaxID=2212470 RepID=A0A849SL74_UNCEI|nr:DUF4956 domain-containing protein [Candidatus Eisenbacteria bacterium]
MMNWLGVDAIADWQGLSRLMLRFALDLFVSTIVIRAIYGRLYRNREFILTYFLFNTTTFFLCYLLSASSIHFGVGLALFGVFGILRYRTEQIPIRDLTYLFIVIGIGVLNGVADRGVSVVELLAVNGTILAVTAALELSGRRSRERATPMLYDRLELLHPGRAAELAADLAARTGMKVLRVDVNQVDLLRDAVEITVYHQPTQ